VTLEGILQKYGPMLGRIVASYEADKALQQELLQEVSLAIWRSLPSFKGEGSIKAYVAKIAQNRAISHVARAVKMPRSTEIPEDMADKGASPEKSAEVLQQKQQLLIAVRRLPIKQRQVVTLILEGLSHREVADSLGLSETNAMVRFSRAKSALKDMMGGE
jgi:RNA polymerase sigma-70 factor (ECF subfamily)